MLANAGDQHPPTVLIVEDEAAIRMAVQETLEDNGFRTVEAANAREALDTIEKMGRTIDLVFTDIRMPGEMDGVRLAQWVHEQMPRIPVIIASAYAQNADEAKAAGEEVFVKPYRMEDVVARIRAAIDRHKDLPAQ